MTVSLSGNSRLGSRHPRASGDPRLYITHCEKNPTLAIAVSGGIDSMALLLLAHTWAKKQSGNVVAITVDHGLRKESAAEAKQVSAWCKIRGIEHHTLTWKPKAKTTQASARNARYALLTGWCKKHPVLHLLTAHHRDDQAETVLFRLARGSGIDGLAGIAAESMRDGVRLLRPLLAYSKSELRNFLHAQKQEWIEDPTNATDTYTRNIVRSHLTPELNEKIASLAARIGVVRNTLDHHLAEAMARTISITADGSAVLSMTEFKKLPTEYGVRTLAALTQTIGDEDTPPRTEKLQRLYRDLLDKKTRTLGGCLFRYRPSKECFTVKRERKTAPGKPFRPRKPLAGSAFLGLNRADK